MTEPTSSPAKEDESGQKLVRKKKRVRKTRKSTVQPRLQIEKVLGYLFTALIVISPFIAGTFDETTHRELALFSLRGICLVIFALFGISVVIRKKPVQMTWFLAILFVFCVWLLIQLMPLPDFLLRTVSWTSYDLYRTQLDNLGPEVASAWRSIALDTSVSGSYFANVVCLLGIFLVASVMSPRERRFRETLNIFNITACVLGLVGLIHLFMGASRMYGFIPIAADIPRFFSVFHSPDELAAYVGLAILVLLSMAAEELSKESRKRNKRYFLMFLFLVLVFVLNASHSANLAMLLASVFLAWKFMQRSKERLAVLAWGQFGILAAASLLVVVGRIALHSFGKWPSASSVLVGQGEIWGDSLSILGHFPLVGIGLGNFPIPHGVFGTSALVGSVEYPANFILQLFIELGFPAGILLLAAFVWVLVDLFTNKQMRRIEIGLAAGLLFLMLFNLWDSNLNSFAIALPFTFFLALLTTRRSERSHGVNLLRHKLELSTVPMLFLLAGIISFALFSSLKALNQELGKDRNALKWQAADVTPGRSVADATIERTINRHPLDWKLHALAADTFSDHSKEELKKKLAFLDNAIRLNVSRASLHRERGVTLLKLDALQDAIPAFELACRYIPDERPLNPVWNTMLKNGLQPEMLPRVTPKVPARERELFFYLIDLGATKGLEAAIDWASSAGLSSDDREMMVARGVVALVRGDVPTAKALADRLMAEHSGYHYGYVLKTLVFLQQNNLQNAKETLENMPGERGRSSMDLQARFFLRLQEKKWRKADSVLKRMEAIYFRSEVFHPRRDELTADLVAAQGKTDSALQLLREALKAGRNRERLLKKILDLELAQEEYEAAHRTWKELFELTPDDPSHPETVRKLEALKSKGTPSSPADPQPGDAPTP